MRTRMFGGINFGDLVQNSPIYQIEISAKVSGLRYVFLVSTYPMNMFSWNESASLESQLQWSF